MPIVLVGQVTNHVGKRLWEIIGCLKDFGVGRMVVRSAFERYPEISFYRILNARPEMDTGPPHHDEDNTRGVVLAERVFRGQNFGLRDISNSAYKRDFKLVPKHEEHKYLEAVEKSTPPEPKLYSPTMEMPPLLRILAERENHEFKEMNVVLSNTPLYRVATEGEIPNAKFSLGLGKPVMPELYEGLLDK